MNRDSVALRLLAFLGALAALFLLFLAVVRPWYLDWGSNREERQRALPGDEVVSGLKRHTRAITIRAPQQRVWPWVAQLGQDRGGFYSYRLLENLVGCQMPEHGTLRPELQQWKAGDSLWMYPPEKLEGRGGAPLVAYQPGRALAFATWQAGSEHTGSPDGLWTFVVDPLGADRSRLVVRSTQSMGRRLPGRIFDSVVFEPIHFTMERKMMTTLQRLAEGGQATPVADALEVVVWMATFAIFVAACAATFRRRDWRRPLVVMLAAGLVLMFLTLGQPGPVVGVIAVFALAVGLWWPSIPIITERRSGAIEERPEQHPAPRA